MLHFTLLLGYVMKTLYCAINVAESRFLNCIVFVSCMLSEPPPSLLCNNHNVGTEKNKSFAILNLSVPVIQATDGKDGDLTDSITCGRQLVANAGASAGLQSWRYGRFTQPSVKTTATRTYFAGVRTSVTRSNLPLSMYQMVDVSAYAVDVDDSGHGFHFGGWLYNVANDSVRISVYCLNSNKANITDGGVVSLGTANITSDLMDTWHKKRNAVHCEPQTRYIQLVVEWSDYDSSITQDILAGVDDLFLHVGSLTNMNETLPYGVNDVACVVTDTDGNSVDCGLTVSVIGRFSIDVCPVMVVVVVLMTVTNNGWLCHNNYR